MKIAFQGEIGAFSEEAVGGLYPHADIVPQVSFELFEDPKDVNATHRREGSRSRDIHRYAQAG